MAFERPRRFRLRAGTGLTGTEVDLGGKTATSDLDYHAYEQKLDDLFARNKKSE